MMIKRVTRSGQCAPKAYPTNVADVVRDEIVFIDRQRVQDARYVIGL
jgi:hypothetical protein